MKLGRGQRPPGVPLVCDVCERVCLPDSEASDWWLSAVNPATNVRVCRCPQHISTWALRTAGVPRSKSTYVWVETARERDTHESAKAAPLVWRRGEP